jgi:hypothetical protein
MIAFAKYTEAHRLLAEGNLSRRKIATLVGISRSTVSAIATGSYAERLASRQARTETSMVPRGPLGRCPQCGGMVYLPCWACHVRLLKEQEQQKRRAVRRLIKRKQQLELLTAARQAHWQRDAIEPAASGTAAPPAQARPMPNRLAPAPPDTRPAR